MIVFINFINEIPLLATLVTEWVVVCSCVLVVVEVIVVVMMLVLEMMVTMEISRYQFLIAFMFPSFFNCLNVYKYHYIK